LERRACEIVGKGRAMGRAMRVPEMVRRRVWRRGKEQLEMNAVMKMGAGRSIDGALRVVV